MSRVLLDTDLLSELLRRRNPKVTSHAASYVAAHERLIISSVTVFEVVRGWCHAGKPDRANEFLQWVSKYAETLPFDAQCAATAGRLGGALAMSGMQIGVADVLIAATAIEHGVPIATGNRAHYERAIPFGLVGIENWRD